MATTINKYGLSRTIPSDVKRKIRQRDGYGCVICGLALVDYEHFEPEYSEAHEHNADNMLLLCRRHHGEKDSFLSRSTIAKAAQNPFCKRSGFSHGAFDWEGSPEVTIGSFTCVDTSVVLKILGDDVLSVRPPEEFGGPFRLSARLANRDGEPILDIIDNEWRISSLNWDAEVIKSRIIIRKANRDIALVMKSEPGVRLVIEQLDMEHKGVKIIGSEGKNFRAISDSMELNFAGGYVRGADYGLHIHENGIAMGVGSSIAAITGPAVIDGGTGYTHLRDTTINPVGSFPFAAGLPLSARIPIRVAKRSQPCPCGSGQKYKLCHGARR